MTTSCGRSKARRVVPLHERTESHLDIFKEGRDAAFFESRDELIDKVRYYLLHDYQRERIRQAGYYRTMSAGHTYRNRLEQILEAATLQPKAITLGLGGLIPKQGQRVPPTPSG